MYRKHADRILRNSLIPRAEKRMWNFSEVDKFEYFSIKNQN